MSGRLAQLAVVGLVAAFGLGAAGPPGELSFGTDLGAESKFLRVDEAFQPTATVVSAGAGKSVRVHWNIAEGYYLYRHQLAFEADAPASRVLGEPSIPPGKEKHDEYFGDIEAYYHALEAELPILASAPGEFQLQIRYQGCADEGLCYPPVRKNFRIVGDSDAVVLPDPKPATSGAAASVAPAAGEPASPTDPVTEGGRLTALLQQGQLLSIMGLFLVAGIGLAFTPCVLPMVPILSSIIIGQSETPTRQRAFNLSLAYVLGMAVTYALLGMVVGYFGAEFNLQAKLQSPAVLVVFAGIFVALSLAMFGVYELQLPGVLRDRLTALSQQQSGGQYVGVATMGVLSSLVVSPCVSAPLAGALVYISSTGDAALGGLALLFLGIGMGVPLLVIGTSGGDLLPRAGAWMNEVKALFGFGLLGVAVWMVERIVPAAAALALWAALALSAAARFGALAIWRAAEWSSWGALRSSFAGLTGIYGVLLALGAATGGSDPLRPWQTLPIVAGEVHEAVAFRRVGDLETLSAALAASQSDRRPVIFDFYADWCISCKVMERTVFTDFEVEAAMARFDLLQIDVTANSDAHQEVLNAYDLFGPPSILFFDASGQEMSRYRVQGEMTRDDFLQHLQAVLSEVAVR